MQSPSFATKRILIVATATVMEMRAAFPGLSRHVPVEHAWSRLGVSKGGLQGRPCGELILLVTGVGPVNAGISLGRLLGSLSTGSSGNASEPVGVLNLGVAGAFSLERLPLGTTVVTTKEIWPEYGLLTASELDPRGIGLAQGKADGEPVWDRLRLTPESCARQMGLDISGLTKAVGLTVAGVSGTPERAEALRTRYACDIETMEGFALAWTCSLIRVPFVQVRTISNLVGSRDAAHWDLNGAKQRLALVASALLGDIEGTPCPN
ncbi:futalosine hydrolase [Desulfonatronum lacustre]|uniref:futalosine hydrolase n=1 Tax=Desulfonatronum lacustre TaxID=66849 RepID=UPI0004B1D4E3|nr:futalosine hydrolase [Desulfonatronum lacustre]SMP43896.1 futalosine hydrolase [Desulfonatronum zhilinae]